MKTRNTTRNYLTAICVAIAALGTAGMAQAQMTQQSEATTFNVKMKVKGTCKFTSNTGGASAMSGADVWVGDKTNGIEPGAQNEQGISVGGGQGAGLVVNCTNGLGFAIGLTPANPDGSDATLGKGLLLKGGTDTTDTVKYALYQPTIATDKKSATANISSTTPWGNIQGTNLVVLEGKGMNADNKIVVPVTARVLQADHALATVGEYSDKVTATVWY